MFVYQGTAEQGPRFFDKLDPSAIAIADPDATIYDAVQIGRGGLRAMFGIRSWRAGVRALRRGHFINRKIGDAWTLPTVLAVHDDAVIGEFRGEHAGDHPDIDELFTRFSGDLDATQTG